MLGRRSAATPMLAPTPSVYGSMGGDDSSDEEMMMDVVDDDVRCTRGARGHVCVFLRRAYWFCRYFDLLVLRKGFSRGGVYWGI